MLNNAVCLNFLMEFVVNLLVCLYRGNVVVFSSIKCTRLHFFPSLAWMK